MKVYKKGTGGKYTPFSHYNMETQVIFNPQSGCLKANITLSTVAKGSGSEDEVHDDSDQIFYCLQGTMNVYANNKLQITAGEGDAVFVAAGETHAVVNEDDTQLRYLAITVPPLVQTH